MWPERPPSTEKNPLRVVVVDGSLRQRGYVVRTLEADGDICVVGQAIGLADAALLIRTLHPHVVTLGDQATPVAGQREVEQILRQLATPVLAMSSDVVLPGQASPPGGFDSFPHPSRWAGDDEAEVRRRVRALRGAKVLTAASPRLRPPRRVVAIAASTGGPSALAKVVSELTGIDAPVLIVQHIHSDFVGGLTSWLARAARIPVRLAVHGEQLAPGIAYVGPGDRHLKLDSAMRIVLDEEPAALHRPSADELFQSVARHTGAGSVGVVLTGMGEDGVRGLKAMRLAGALTIAQDEASSAVFGMPHAAQLAGAVCRMLPLDRIAAAVLATNRMVGA